MRESHSSPNLVTSHHNSSIRLRKRRDEAKHKFLRNRRSVGIDNSHENENDENDKVSTLDPVVGAAAHLQHLRPLLRSKYSKQGEDKRKIWRERDEGGIKITDFGMIDHPPLQRLKSEPYSSLNCFSLSSGCTVLEVRKQFIANNWLESSNPREKTVDPSPSPPVFLVLLVW